MTLNPPRRRILIVDWELEDARRMAELLDAEGFYVRVCSQPRIALRHVRLAPFWLCIMNSTLPGMEAVDFVRRLRRLRPLASVLILGGEIPPEAADRLRAHGIEMQLQKPIRPELFLDVMRALVRIGRSIAPVTQADQPGLPSTGPTPVKPVSSVTTVIKRPISA